MKIAVLFDGGGLARKGLEDVGHDCTGFEIDPAKHYLSLMVGSGNSVLADVREVDLSPFDAVWASPPCQERSDQKVAERDPENAALLEWSLKIDRPILWVENVISGTEDNSWGKFYNAAQFLELPKQRRRRLIGGRYTPPPVWREYKNNYPEWEHIAPPAPMAHEIYSGGLHQEVDKERRRFTRWYKRRMGRKPTLFDIAYHQGFEMPLGWFTPPVWWVKSQKLWLKEICQALGNGVPVYMAYGFGAAYSNAPVAMPVQLELFA